MFEGVWGELQSKTGFQRQSVTKYLRLILQSVTKYFRLTLVFM